MSMETSRQIARTRQEAYDAMRFDPITYETLDDPVVDPCGHTYNRKTADQFSESGLNKIKCPFSRRIFAKEQLTHNLYAQNVVNYFKEEEKNAGHSASSSSSSSTTSQNVASSSSSSSSSMTSTASTLSPQEIAQIIQTFSEEMCRVRETHLNAIATMNKWHAKLQCDLQNLEKTIKDMQYQVNEVFYAVKK